MTTARISTFALLSCLVPSAVLGQKAFKTGEEKTGLTKQCYYRFGSSTYARTMKSYELCPLSIELGSPGASGGAGCVGMGCALSGLAQGLTNNNSATSNAETVAVPAAVIALIKQKVEEMQALIAIQQEELLSLRRENADLRSRLQTTETKSESANQKRLGDSLFAASLSGARSSTPVASQGVMRASVCAFALYRTPMPDVYPDVDPSKLSQLREQCALREATAKGSQRGYLDPRLLPIDARIDLLLSSNRTP